VNPGLRLLQIGRRRIAQRITQSETVATNAQQKGRRRIRAIYLPVSMQQRERRHRMAGVAVVMLAAISEK